MVSVPHFLRSRHFSRWPNVQQRFHPIQIGRRRAGESGGADWVNTQPRLWQAHSAHHLRLPDGMCSMGWPLVGCWIGCAVGECDSHQWLRIQRSNGVAVRPDSWLSRSYRSMRICRELHFLNHNPLFSRFTWWEPIYGLWELGSYWFLREPELCFNWWGGDGQGSDTVHLLQSIKIW